nr:chromatin assembly factor 1 subunit FAS1 [Ipomoea batatas]
MKDPELDYEIDSDEEWEEEEPGESLSDCDKDEVESLDEECTRGDDEESEDGFFVPDGYLYEDESTRCIRITVMAYVRWVLWMIPTGFEVHFHC